MPERRGGSIIDVALGRAREAKRKTAFEEALVKTGRREKKKEPVRKKVRQKKPAPTVVGKIKAFIREHLSDVALKKKAVGVVGDKKRVRLRKARFKKMGNG